MEDKFNPDDFEEFLQDQVRNQRMYPNDAVWRDINKKLHGEKRWPALTIAAFLLLSVTAGICIHFTSKSNLFSIKPGLEPINSSKEVSKSDNFLNKLGSTAPYDEDKKDIAELATKGQNEKTGYSKLNNTGGKNSFVIERTNMLLPIKESEPNGTITAGNSIQIARPLQNNLRADKPWENIEKGIKTNSGETPLSTNTNKDPFPKKVNTPSLKSDGQKEFNDKNMVDNFLKDHENDIALHTITKPNTVKHTFGFQIYVAPSFSYRNLIEDKSMQKETNSGPVGINYVTDVNNVVRHKPGTGIEAGLGILYNLSDKVRIKSGLQFNVRQYSINAYRSNREIASIALIGTNRIDTVNTVAVYRNYNGYSSTELVNRYYQVAVPIGVEWEVIGNRKVQVNVAASIQPTYLINRNAYLLSTNFKNYTENPDMVRAWNLNSNLEAFISYHVGDFKWQVGPQIRYQPYSTFIRQYPIKEHLLDYGVKVGVSKTF